MQTHVVVIGAGPAGLTAAYQLSKAHLPVTVLEADAQYVGGIARTVTYKGYCFDIGGHRFFSKSKEVEALWTEMLPDDMLERPRSSRIFYRGQFFSYPLKSFEALHKLGVWESFLCVISYIKARLLPISPVNSFTDWVTNHFGKRLFNIFFKTYTEKVWGMRCDDISADWAAQRIKGLSLFSAVMNAFFSKNSVRSQHAAIKTLIDTFRYPRKGPGMLWEACAEKIKRHGGEVLLNSEVYSLAYDPQQNQWQVLFRDHTGASHMVRADHIICSAPLRNLILEYLPQAVSTNALHAAESLQYRDFLIVVLILKDKHVFTDNWLYIHDPAVEVARIQNFKSWSEEMVPHPEMCCYGMEYFCFQDDKTWSATDDDLIQKASLELVKLGLAELTDILDGCVVRQSKAYPVYDNAYQAHVNTIVCELENAYPTLHLVGRNGMHKYNNQDHAMMTAMLTVKNIIAGKRLYNTWCVNQDAQYLEAGQIGDFDLTDSLRQTPFRH